MKKLTLGVEQTRGRYTGKRPLEGFRSSWRGRDVGGKEAWKFRIFMTEVFWIGGEKREIRHF